MTFERSALTSPLISRVSTKSLRCTSAVGMATAELAIRNAPKPRPLSNARAAPATALWRDFHDRIPRITTALRCRPCRCGPADDVARLEAGKNHDLGIVAGTDFHGVLLKRPSVFHPDKGIPGIELHALPGNHQRVLFHAE